MYFSGGVYVDLDMYFSAWSFTLVASVHFSGVRAGVRAVLYGSWTLAGSGPADKDVVYLNSLAYQLMRLAHLQKDFTAFFPYDRDTRIFIRYSEPGLHEE